MIEYAYKQICEECFILVDSLCDNCSGVGYTESTSADLPDNAYDIEAATTIIANLEPCTDEIEYDDFQSDIVEEFTKHKFKKVYVEGKDLTWRNLTGTQKFILDDPMDIVWKLVPTNADFTYRIEKITNNHYKVESSNHDGKEYFEIKIRKVS